MIILVCKLLQLCTYSDYIFLMKSENLQKFFVKQINEKEKQITLNNKYTIKQDNRLFEVIDFIINDLNEKNEMQKKKYHDVFQISYFPTVQFELGNCKMEDEKCMICLEEYSIKNIEQEAAKQFDDDILMLGCSHKFHKNCMLQMIGEKKWAKCPICSTIFGKMTGDQPPGTMNYIVDKNLTCSGHPKGTIIINYYFSSGTMNGKKFTGTSRTAYLPDSPQGNEALSLLKEAFDRKLTFTVGRSVTTGLDNQVVWNGIHHKTSINGGAANFGFPDPTYLTRVKEQLACKGILSKK